MLGLAIIRAYKGDHVHPQLDILALILLLVFTLYFMSGPGPAPWVAMGKLPSKLDITCLILQYM